MSALYAGVDLGGTSVKCVLAEADGRIIVDSRIPTDGHEGPLRVLERIGDEIESLIKQAGRKPEALGMGVPGLVDVQQGITRFLPNMTTHWRDIPAASILNKQLGVPVRLLNDVRMATLGELTFGRGRNSKDLTMVFIAIGTGIGGGIVIDGKLRLGPDGAAGELGHQTIDPTGPRCGCGNHGCLETLASGTALAAEGIRLMLMGLAPTLHGMVAGDPGNVTAELMSRAAETDGAIRDAILHAGAYLGIGVGNVVTTLFPELVVVGGGVANMGDLLFNQIRDEVRRRVSMFPIEKVSIEPSLLGSQAGMLGAIALASRGLPGDSAQKG